MRVFRPGVRGLSGLATFLLLTLTTAPPLLAGSPELDGLLSDVAKDVVAEFAPNGLTDQGLSISLLDLSTPGFPAGSFRGDVAYYPASV
ncbi:MAG TPA: hypothetical protein VGK70_00585, partial [Thermoanaerobaculia bacterium]